MDVEAQEDGVVAKILVGSDPARSLSDRPARIQKTDFRSTVLSNRSTMAQRTYPLDQLLLFSLRRPAKSTMLMSKRLSKSLRRRMLHPKHPRKRSLHLRQRKSQSRKTSLLKRRKSLHHPSLLHPHHQAASRSPAMSSSPVLSQSDSHSSAVFP